MLFTGILSSLNKAMESALSNIKQDFDDEDSIIDEKKSMYSDKLMFERLRRTVSPPSPTKVAPLWKEQVDSNIKNGLNPLEIHRQEIMFEIIRTEKAFVDDIRYLNEHYVKTIQCSGIRLPPSLNETFKILPDILLLHFNVSWQLLCIQAIMYPIIPSIAHILRELATQFRMYESYLVHHKMAISEIANARKKNNKLGQLVKNLESDIPPGPPGRILTLESLLTKPFQRLCKYPLLVMTLLRATAPDHKDHSQLMDLHNQIDCALENFKNVNQNMKVY
ncbi:hypothetical protein RclHR1_01030019 [Rhizophagus clarus]|uniref:DH domain-containing protein n=1 Tax=Rhizophagus clarus TaxID=94130 RepID=A0A2Z6QFE9_9GLOM|nr:hypothetical protein RclHR1_01030019 [Rhizophagus clarus]